MVSRSPWPDCGKRWQGADQQVIESCTLLTTAANEVVAPIHDRMPVFLPAAAHDRWLDPTLTQADTFTDLYRPCPAADLLGFAVSPLVSTTAAYDGPEYIEPAEPRGLFDLPLTV